MKSLLVGMHAETFLHPGSGQNDGAIDLPIARERSTDFPIIYGSMLKGALRARLYHAAKANLTDEKKLDENTIFSTPQIDQFFGKHENAGGILVGDARLLLLPVRSLSASFKWVTCPQILQRLIRDRARAGEHLATQIPSIKPQQYVSFGKTAETAPENLFLEEWLFTQHTENFSSAKILIEAIQGLMPKEVSSSLAERLVIINNDDFAILAKQSLPIHARNVLNNDTKSSENLWYEETISPDTLFYSLFLPRFNEALLTEFAESQVHGDPYLQVGGNETIGQGWVRLTAYASHKNNKQEAA